MKVYKAYAKVNIFLKITGTRDDYHEIISRFMRVNNLCDELSFVPNETKKFTIVGDFDCTLEQNTIYKAYKNLLEFTSSDALERLMQTHAVQVNKKIPVYAGLGGGSSDAATYLKMCNEVLHLGLSVNELVQVGLKVGADVAFFLYDYKSANVSGIGEIVEEFEEESLNIETFTPNIKIATPQVYKAYRKNFFVPIDAGTIQKLKSTTSLEILDTMSIDKANDLYNPALSEYKELESYYKDGWFFSGSGSSFFRVVKEK